MTYLKYYKKENIKYSEYNQITLSKLETVGLCYYVCAELKIPMVTIAFRKMKSHLGLYHEKQKRVTFNTKVDISLLTVAHELGHYIDVKRHGSYNLGHDNFYDKKKYRKAHTKKHEKCVKIVLKIFDNLIKSGVK